MKDRHNTNRFVSTATLKCPICKSTHALYICDTFGNSTLQNRGLLWQDTIRFNCMHGGHKVHECANPHHCKQCKKCHHTLLHQNRREQMSKAPEIEANSRNFEETRLSPTETRQGSYCSFKEQRSSHVLLAMATIKVTDSWGIQQPCRILLGVGTHIVWLMSSVLQSLLNFIFFYNSLIRAPLKNRWKKKQISKIVTKRGDILEFPVGTLVWGRLASSSWWTRRLKTLYVPVVTFKPVWREFRHSYSSMMKVRMFWILNFAWEKLREFRLRCVKVIWVCSYWR